MPSATATIPAAHVDELRRTLISLYGTEAEAAHQAAQEYLAGQAPAAPLLVHRDELLKLDRLIEQTGWASLEQPPRDLELRGNRRLLGAAVYGVFIDLCERVAKECQQLWLGEGEPERVRQAAEGVLALLPLAASLGVGRSPAAEPPAET
jgi:hypothetical protein